MPLSNASQAVIIVSAFLLPLVTYILHMRIAKPETASALPSPTEITNLFIYPVKSCHGISVPSALLLPTGLDLGKFVYLYTWQQFATLSI